MRSRSISVWSPCGVIPLLCEVRVESLHFFVESVLSHSTSVLNLCGVHAESLHFCVESLCFCVESSVWSSCGVTPLSCGVREESFQFCIESVWSHLACAKSLHFCVEFMRSHSTSVWSHSASVWSLLCGIRGSHFISVWSLC